MNRTGMVLAAVATLAATAGWAVPRVEIAVDPTAEIGAIKPMNAVNNGPSVGKPKGDQVQSNARAYAAARFPYARLHDSISACPGGAHCVDITAVFPDFDADENDPKSYDFVFTDAYLKAIVASGTKVFFRLGQTIEHGPKKYGVMPPKDFAKWARICEHVIRHYNEGWADGFRMGIEYWEIWNEPDIDFGRQKPDGRYAFDLDDIPEGPRCWGGSANQFFDFFVTAATHLKKAFPALRIGGPAMCGGRNRRWIEPFLDRLQKDKVPLDFFSWHSYGTNPDGAAACARYVRETLDRHGYDRTESILDEWNYVADFGGDFVSTLRAESGDRNLVGAAYCAGMLNAMQNEPVDMLMYYDARPRAAMNGLFESPTLWPMKAYYAFYSWAKLVDLGRQVKATVSGANAVRKGYRFPPIAATAAKGEDGSVAVFVSRSEGDLNVTVPVVVRLAVKDRTLAGAFAHVTDDRCQHTEVPLVAEPDGSATLVLQARSFALVELRAAR